MKAAILNQLGLPPVYGDYEDPISGEGQLLISVKAAAVKNLDKARASGTHYASYENLPTTIGIDGVGILEDGRRVYAQGLTGMIAEKAVISPRQITELPLGIDYETAAALPNAVIGSAMALLIRAEIKEGQNILINGATGVTGMIAVQLARHYKANKIIVTGRNEEQLQKVLQLGADISVSLKQNDDDIINQLKAIHAENHIDIVIDYLWGKPVELILKSVKGGSVSHESGKVRIVTVGEMAGPTINLGSGFLRSSDIEIMGSGFGSLSQKDLENFNQNILPQMFLLAAKGQLKIETDIEPLSNIENAWIKETEPGKRLVIKIAD
ncbi:NADPH:quinone reductase-like Zn-dependent oxidoreductase [Elizabethkingia sp. YR214]|uniref:quinone oxidoreductase family protein n=1 Tax=Elizabethkingia sp. YR214 TaxID=2135667 RepID=UPI000D2FC09B|nr:zinc-binding alcohol dehydrogenase family protein [Elizabethkingia sp. YR214]PUB30888.1 NADPH:quinone reductase-like Zn-dependent oxidoreductase [Elizabethkingia sp. YR214]